MDRNFSRRLSRGIHCRLASVLIAVCVAASGASARVTTLTINDTQSAFGGASFGSVGTYEVITGTFTDEVDPNDPHNAVITDIGLGPKNPNATVSFTADFQIIRPTNLANSAHRVIYDLPNRGSPGPGVGTLLGSPPVNTAVPPSSGGAGNGFLMNMGWTDRRGRLGPDRAARRRALRHHPAGGEKPRWIIDHGPRASRSSSSIKARRRRTCRSPIRRRALTSPKPC